MSAVGIMSTSNRGCSRSGILRKNFDGDSCLDSVLN